MSFDEEAFLEEIRAKAARHGHAVVRVAGRELPDQWSYTVGLHAHGLPELVIMGGIGAEAQHSVLDRLARRMREGEALVPGERDDDVLEGVDVTYVEVEDTTTADLAVAGRLQSGFRALQVVWPDLENRFPWEPGYAFPPDEQRLLGAPPG